MAEELSRERPSDRDDGPSPLSEFVQLYREWIAGNRDRDGTQAEQAERWQLVCHAMVTAPTIEQAIALLIRFGRVVWGGRGPTGLHVEGEEAVLRFTEPHRPDAEGLIAAIWPLALTLCELEFLAHARFRGVSGRVPHRPLLPEGVAGLLFGAPLAYEAGEVALVFPRHHLRRPVVARPEALPAFFRSLLPLTLGAGRAAPDVRTMAAGLIRDDALAPTPRETSLDTVAARLGMSAATLRRRLAGEGASFRKVKEDVHAALARDWLRQREIPVARIAAMLGYSDSFAFRRFFRRMEGMSPLAFRARDGAASGG